MLSVADRRPCLLLFDLDLFNDVPHGAIVVSATQGNSVIVRGPAASFKHPHNFKQHYQHLPKGGATFPFRGAQMSPHKKSSKNHAKAFIRLSIINKRGFNFDETGEII